MLSRRTVLRVGALVTLATGPVGLAGCVVERDPTVQGRPEATPVGPGATDAVDWARHARLSDQLGDAASGAPLGDFADFAAAACAEHATLFSSWATRPASEEAAAAGSVAETAASVAQAHGSPEAAGERGARLVSAAALAAAIASTAQAPAPAQVQIVPATATWQPVGDRDALTELIAHLHPAVFAAEAALGRLGAEDAGWLRPALTSMRSARQMASAELEARGVQVPVAAPAYQVGHLPDEAAAVGLMAEVLPSVMGPAVRAAAAVGTGPVSAAVRVVARDVTAAVARAAGPLSTWPGWE